MASTPGHLRQMIKVAIPREERQIVLHAAYAVAY